MGVLDERVRGWYDLEPHHQPKLLQRGKEMFSRLVGIFRPAPVAEVPAVEELNARLHEIHARLDEVLA